MKAGKRQSDALLKAVVEKFRPNFMGSGPIMYLSGTGEEPAVSDTKWLADSGIKTNGSIPMPSAVLRHGSKGWLALVDVAPTHGPIDGQRRKQLKELFSSCKAGL